MHGFLCQLVLAAPVRKVGILVESELVVAETKINQMVKLAGENIVFIDLVCNSESPLDPLYPLP